jgi:rhodanese-related sulfurtransferase
MKTPFDKIEGFVPTDRRKAAVCRSSHRSAQAIRIMMHVADRDALGANVAL